VTVRSLEGLHARIRRLNHRRAFHVLLNVCRRGTEHYRLYGCDHGCDEKFWINRKAPSVTDSLRVAM